MAVRLKWDGLQIADVFEEAIQLEAIQLELLLLNGNRDDSA